MSNEIPTTLHPGWLVSDVEEPTKTDYRLLLAEIDKRVAKIDESFEDALTNVIKGDAFKATLLSHVLFQDQEYLRNLIGEPGLTKILRAFQALHDRQSDGARTGAPENRGGNRGEPANKAKPKVPELKYRDEWIARKKELCKDKPDPPKGKHWLDTVILPLDDPKFIHTTSGAKYVGEIHEWLAYEHGPAPRP